MPGRTPALSALKAGEWALALYFAVICFLGLYLTVTYPLRGHLGWLLSEGLKDVLWIAAIPFIAKPAFRGFRLIDDMPMALYFTGYIAFVTLSVLFSPPGAGLISLAVYRNIFIFALLPFYAFAYIVAKRGSDGIDKLVVAAGVIEALIGIAQYLLGSPSEFILSRYSGSVGGENMICGGLFSYIEYSAILNIALATILSRKTIRLIDGLAIGLLVFAMVVCESRLGLLVCLSLLLWRYPVPVGLIGLIVFGIGLVAYLGDSFQHRLLTEGFTTPRTFVWLESIDSARHIFVRFQYGRWGGATSVTGQTFENYVDSSVISGFMQGGLLGAAFVLFPFFRISVARLRIGPGAFSARKRLMLLFVMGAYAVWFNFVDGWPGNFLFWSIAGCIMGSSCPSLPHRGRVPFQRQATSLARKTTTEAS